MSSTCHTCTSDSACSPPSHTLYCIKATEHNNPLIHVSEASCNFLQRCPHGVCVQGDIAAFKDYTADDSTEGGAPKKQAAPKSEGKKPEGKQEPDSQQKPQKQEAKAAPAQPKQPSGNDRLPAKQPAVSVPSACCFSSLPCILACILPCALNCLKELIPRQMLQRKQATCVSCKLLTAAVNFTHGAEDVCLTTGCSQVHTLSSQLVNYCLFDPAAYISDMPCRAFRWASHRKPLRQEAGERGGSGH